MLKYYIQLFLAFTSLGIAYTQSVQFEAEGAIKVSNSNIALNSPGPFQWNGDFEVWNGQQWVSLTKGFPVCTDGHSINYNLGNFGSSIDLYDQTAMVSATHFSMEGSVVVLKKINSAWVISDTLYAPDGTIGNNFGRYISIFGDYAVISATTDDNNKGAVYVFKQTAGQWNYLTKITAPDAMDDQYFGGSVSISSEFILAEAGIGYSGFGSVYVFKLTSSDNWEYLEKWEENAYLFGADIKINGDYAIVGAYGDNGNKGTVFIYHWNGLNWSPPVQILPEGLEAYDNFGQSVAMDYPYCSIIAPGKNDGRGIMSIYHHNGTSWSVSQDINLEGSTSSTSWTIDFSSSNMVIGYDSYNSQSHVKYFEFSNNQWEQKKIYRSSASNEDINFGTSVSLFNNEILVGAPSFDTNIGSVYFFNN